MRNSEILRSVDTESVERNRAQFGSNVDSIRIWYRRAQRLESMAVQLDYKEGYPHSPYAINEPGGFVDLLNDLGVNSGQLQRIFELQGNLHEPLYKALWPFKKGGHQRLADLLGKPIQYGWYDGFMESGSIGEPVLPRKGHRINPEHRIWRTNADDIREYQERMRIIEVERRQRHGLTSDS